MLEQLPLDPTLPNQPASEQLPLPQTTGPASVLAAPSSHYNAGPASSWSSSVFIPQCQTSKKTLSGRAKATYSRQLEDSSKQLPPVSHDVAQPIVTQGQPIASKFQKLDREIGSNKSGIQASVGRQDHPAFHLSVVQSATQGKEG